MSGQLWFVPVPVPVFCSLTSTSNVTRALNPPRQKQSQKTHRIKSISGNQYAALLHPLYTPVHSPDISQIANHEQTIFSDAILGMLNAPAETVNGLVALDEDFLRNHCGVTDFSKYAVVPGSTPRRIMPKELPVLEVAEQDDEGNRMDSTAMRANKL